MSCPAPSSRSSRAASSSTSGCAASCPPRWSSCAACVTCSRTWASRSEAKIIEPTRTATTWCCSAGPGWRRPSASSARTSSPTSSQARPARAWCRASYNFGAFVDLGGMDGLIHVSELSWKYVDHQLDRGRGRRGRGAGARRRCPASASACRSRPRPRTRGRSSPPATASASWCTAEVTKLVPFGAFVQVGEGIEGLVHISEMSAHHVDLPEQVVTPGEELWSQDHRPRPAAPAHQPVDQAGRRGRHRGRRVPGALRRARLRRPGQLHRPPVEHSPEADEAWAEYYAEVWRGAADFSERRAGWRPTRPSAEAGPEAAAEPEAESGRASEPAAKAAPSSQPSPPGGGHRATSRAKPRVPRPAARPTKARPPAGCRAVVSGNVRRRAGHRAHRGHRVRQVGGVGPARRQGRGGGRRRRHRAGRPAAGHPGVRRHGRRPWSRHRGRRRHARP